MAKVTNDMLMEGLLFWAHKLEEIGDFDAVSKLFAACDVVKNKCAVTPAAKTVVPDVHDWAKVFASGMRELLSSSRSDGPLFHCDPEFVNYVAGIDKCEHVDAIEMVCTTSEKPFFSCGVCAIKDKENKYIQMSSNTVESLAMCVFAHAQGSHRKICGKCSKAIDGHAQWIVNENILLIACYDHPVKENISAQICSYCGLGVKDGRLFPCEHRVGDSDMMITHRLCSKHLGCCDKSAWKDYINVAPVKITPESSQKEKVKAPQKYDKPTQQKKHGGNYQKKGGYAEQHQAKLNSDTSSKGRWADIADEEDGFHVGEPISLNSSASAKIEGLKYQRKDQTVQFDEIPVIKSTKLPPLKKPVCSGCGQEKCLCLNK